MMCNRVGKTLFLASSRAAASCTLDNHVNDSNPSNNSLKLAPGANLQNFNTPKPHDTTSHTDDDVLRGTLPTANAMQEPFKNPELRLMTTYTSPAANEQGFCSTRSNHSYKRSH